MRKTSNTVNVIPIKKLGEICTYSKGKKPPILKDTKSSEFSVPYINIKAFEKGIVAEYTNGVKCNICHDDDLLMVWDGARCGLIGKAKKGAVGSTLMKILPKENIHKEYLYHFISSKFWTLNTKPKGVGIPHIEPTLLWNFELVVPPLPEQHAIVAKIEELLSELDNGKQQLQTAQQQLKVYRQSLLKWAFEGKLCLNYDSSDLYDENGLKADSKPKNHSNQENQKNHGSDKGGLPKGWKVEDLKNVCLIKRGKSKHRPRNEPSLFGGKYPFIQTGDIREVNGGYIKKYTQTYSEFGLQQSKLWPKGSLCITIAANIGETAILSFDACFPDSVVGLLCNENLLLNKYANYFFISHKSKLEKLAPATAQKNINLNILEKVKIPLPSIQEQQLIVDELESKLTVCDKVEETISQSLQQAEILRQSILKKAFEGKLVNYESLITKKK